MSSTRRVQDGQHRRQNGWASALEYVELRPLDGTAVAFKAKLQDAAPKRELLYFLQGLSLREGGVRRIAGELLNMFPDRIGTPTMHKIGCRPGKRISVDQSDAISAELSHDNSARDFRAAFRDEEEKPDVRAADEWIELCRERCEQIPEFIEELCCDPKIEVSNENTSCPSYRGIVGGVLDDTRRILEGDSRLAKERPDLARATNNSRGFRTADVPYFHDILGALFEFKRRYEEQACANYVETSIGKIVFEAFDYALETGRSALVEGNSGFGKSTALEVCCNSNLGRARYLKLTGITNRTTFAQKLSDALGVACGKAFSPARKLIRCEEFLRRTKLMLAIDEGQYLWPQGKRIVSHPELINWLDTACYNEGVPFLISATKQFTVQRQAVERQTDWSSEQARRRMRKVFPLPDVPTVDDLRKVARQKLAGLSEAAVEFVVGYALSSRGYFQTITDAIEDAQLIARKAGREKFTANDLQIAVKEWRAPSDAALQRVFDSKPVKQPRQAAQVPGRSPGGHESPEREFNEPLTRYSRPLETNARRETQPAMLVPG